MLPRASRDLFILSIIFATLTFVSCQKPTANDSYFRDVPLAYRSDMHLGSGFDVLDQRVLPNDCVESTDQTSTESPKADPKNPKGSPKAAAQASQKQNGEAHERAHVYEFEFIENNEQFAKKLSLDGVLNLSGMAGNASLSASWLRDHAINSFNTYILLRSVRDFDPVQLSNVHLKKQYRELLAPTDANQKIDLPKFREVCGDGFISHLSRRAEFYGLIKIETTSSEAKSELKAALSAVTNKNFFVDADLKANAENTLSKTLENKRISVSIISAGGPEGLSTPTELPNLKELFRIASDFNTSLQTQNENAGAFVKATVHYYTRLVDAPLPNGFREDFDRAVELFNLARKTEFDLLSRQSDLNVVRENPDRFKVSSESDRQETPQAVLERAQQQLQNIKRNLEQLALLRQDISQTVRTNLSMQHEKKRQDNVVNIPVLQSAKTKLESIQENANSEIKNNPVPKSGQNRKTAFTIKPETIYFHPGWAKHYWKDAKSDNAYRYGFQFEMTREQRDLEYECTLTSRASSAKGTSQKSSTDTTSIALPNGKIFKNIDVLGMANFPVYYLTVDAICTSKKDPNEKVIMPNLIDVYMQE